MEINNQKKIDIVMFEYDYGLIYLKCLNSEDNQYLVTDEFEYLAPIESLGLSKKIEQELYKLGNLYGEILNLEQDDPQNLVGFRTLEEVRYYFYYKLYVATLLSGEYKQGNILLYGFDTVYGNSQKKDNLYMVEEYIKHLSTLTDEDLKVWLRADLQ
ncbi:hypothetical protein [Sulfurospirillum sp. hDNRA2]|uniref:hypothetical protein n=1 Tax=Sulfurospirillum sp. hDNRA2 TaxID=3237298 RepID=UPI0020B8D07E|nr:hypothetical protein [Sulfurospirillum sp. DNRA8]MCP3650816.1 hypothetical protein [Sulfurospirillum sp. DNRA8]MCR1809661.1 hypothetical protein [Sulfurospirillum sp. DNRA8]